MSPLCFLTRGDVVNLLRASVSYSRLSSFSGRRQPKAEKPPLGKTLFFPFLYLIIKIMRTFAPCKND
jgi:hypothetical protein